MNGRSARADFFDASALAKVCADEEHSEVVRSYFNSRSTKYTTPFCFYETLTVLKAKLRGKPPLLTRVEYLDAAARLAAWFRASSSRVADISFTEPEIFAEARAIAERSALDLSDVFQILSVKRGYFSVLANESATVLVTADKELAIAARAERLRVWHVGQDAPPQ